MADSHAAVPRNGVLQLSGYGIRVSVERGHLSVEDGVGRDRRVGRFYRADRSLRRLVVLGHSGEVTLDALRWLYDVGASFVQIDTDGRVIAAAGPVKLQDARLRRAQASVIDRMQGLEIAKELVREKLAGQLRVLERLRHADFENEAEYAKAMVEEAMGRIKTQPSFDQLRLLEAGAAAVYWHAWSPLPIQFEKRDLARIPNHWRSFGRRSSLLTGSPRKATNPANAVLNYLYAIVEAEARLAALAVGCDPGIGVMHADQQSRDSLACDLMEPVRPMVDEWVLDLFESREFAKADFVEVRDGGCRILPPLTRMLAETAPQWAKAVGPVAERVAAQLMATSKAASRARPRLPTPLTQRNRSVGRDEARRGWTEVRIGDEVYDRERFSKEIRPKLEFLSLRTLMEAIPVSKAYAASVRSGKRLPHPKHWGSLRALVS